MYENSRLVSKFEDFAGVWRQLAALCRDNRILRRLDNLRGLHEAKDWIDYGAQRGHGAGTKQIVQKTSTVWSAVNFSGLEFFFREHSPMPLVRVVAQKRVRQVPQVLNYTNATPAG